MMGRGERHVRLQPSIIQIAVSRTSSPYYIVDWWPKLMPNLDKAESRISITYLDKANALVSPESQYANSSSSFTTCRISGSSDQHWTQCCYVPRFSYGSVFINIPPSPTQFNKFLLGIYTTIYFGTVYLYGKCVYNYQLQFF